MAVRSGRARVGWNITLGTTMRLRVELTPSATSYPISDMTAVTAVTFHVTRADGQTVLLWVATQIGSATTALTTWGYVYGSTDLTDEETLTVVALMTTAGGVIPSDPFEILVEA